VCRRHYLLHLPTILFSNRNQNKLSYIYKFLLITSP
jgi:hypothetical protein